MVANCFMGTEIAREGDGLEAKTATESLVQFLRIWFTEDTGVRGAALPVSQETSRVVDTET